MRNYIAVCFLAAYAAAADFSDLKEKVVKALPFELPTWHHTKLDLMNAQKEKGISYELQYDHRHAIRASKARHNVL